MLAAAVQPTLRMQTHTTGSSITTPRTPPAQGPAGQAGLAHELESLRQQVALAVADARRADLEVAMAQERVASLTQVGALQGITYIAPCALCSSVHLAWRIAPRALFVSFVPLQRHVEACAKPCVCVCVLFGGTERGVVQQRSAFVHVVHGGACVFARQKT